jgi:hypothetical protein
MQSIYKQNFGLMLQETLCKLGLQNFDFKSLRVILILVNLALTRQAWTLGILAHMWLDSSDRHLVFFIFCIQHLFHIFQIQLR